MKTNTFFRGERPLVTGIGLLLALQLSQSSPLLSDHPESFTPKVQTVQANGVLPTTDLPAPHARPEIRSAPSGSSASIPVLLYHHLIPHYQGANSAIIAVSDLQWQMAWLQEHGYTSITTAELDLWLNGTGSLPPKPVLITFDDGYLSNLTYGLPILRQYGMKAALFVVGATAGVTAEYEKLSWAQMNQMRKTGLFEIQAHSDDGHREIEGKPALIAWSTAEIQVDLNRLQSRFAKAGLPALSAFAYPNGSYDDEATAAIAASKLRLAFTVDAGYVRVGDDRFRLKRLIVGPGTSRCQFESIVTGQSSCS